MHGFKDSTKTHFVKGGSAPGPRGAAKHSQVMAAFKGKPAPTVNSPPREKGS